ncbi:MAG: 6,7-dimethyl-8-ribityllumazine synthase [Alphaproteobacteria bacterium]|nr:6,7-dimethyl-8-ribityllumazine synthase [Alphaproteobacteria bacterium]
MSRRDEQGGIEPVTIDGSGHRFLIIEAPYYQDVAAALIEGARAEFDAAGASYDRIEVPGALEIPQALGAAIRAGLMNGGARAKYAGAIALGCVIRGETSHYDIVCNNANHWMMELAIHNGVPLGNAILTVDTHEQAMVRAAGGRRGKGADAARACLRLVELAGVFDGAGA